MRIIGVCIGVLFGLSTTVSGYWESIGPDGGPVNHVLQSLVDSELFFAFGGGKYSVEIFRSDDGGASWSSIGALSNSVYTVDIGPTDVMYAGYPEHISVSDDLGLSWTSHSIPGFYPSDIAVHPTDPDIILSAGYRLSAGNYYIAIARSTNGGSSWSVIDVTTSINGYGRCISISASSPGTVFVGGSSRSPVTPKLYKSTNGGTSFVEINNSAWSADYYVYSVAINPVNPDIICAGTWMNIYRTTNGGTSWSLVSGADRNYSMIYSKANPNVVISGGSDCIYRSLNAGASWTTHTSGLGGGPHQSLIADWSTSANVFTTSTMGIFKSENTGSSFFSSSGGMLTAGILTFHAVETAASWTLFLSAINFGIYRTTDNGATLELLNMPLDCGDICAFATRPASADTVLALEGAG
jgi:photosystem II stability/assembly factor-like uncharacterized protein